MSTQNGKVIRVVTNGVFGHLHHCLSKILIWLRHCSEGFCCLLLMLCDQRSCLSWASCLVPNTMTGTVVTQQTFSKWIKTLHLTQKRVIHLFSRILSKIVSFFLFILGRTFFSFQVPSGYRRSIICNTKQIIF